MNRQQVIDSWIAGRKAKMKNRNVNPTLHTDGENLYSYSQCVGITSSEFDTVGSKVVIDKRRIYSQTTSRHVSMAMCSVPDGDVITLDQWGQFLQWRQK